MTIVMNFHKHTKEEPWRCECLAFGLRSDSTKGGSFDLCRQLVALGVEDQPVVVFRDGKPALLIRSLIEGAKLTILENESLGPVLARYRPYPNRQDSDCGNTGHASMRFDGVSATSVARQAEAHNSGHGNERKEGGAP